MPAYEAATGAAMPFEIAPLAELFAERLDELEERTVRFVSSLCESDLPVEVKESALFNVSTLRTQTCFRTPDGYLFGWEVLLSLQQFFSGLRALRMPKWRASMVGAMAFAAIAQQMESD